jgi:long-chain acyl-CoA synthetase
VEGYGLTETSPIVTCSTPGSWKYRRLGCVGSPLPGVKLLIVNPATMEEVSGEEEGEICISGPSVTPGYRNNPEANEKSFFIQNGTLSSVSLFSLAAVVTFARHCLLSLVLI